MRRPNQIGAAPALVIACFLLALLLIAAAVFGWWAYQGRQDYKNHVDQRVAAASAQAKADQKTADSKTFAEAAKSPTKTYSGAATYGTLSFSYPKTWDAYVDDTNLNQPLNSYYYPDYVPATTANLAYALRVQLLSDSYDSVINSFSGTIKQGKLSAVAYIPPKMKDVKNAQLGTRLDGTLAQNIQGAMVVVRVRDKTLKIWTESSNFMADFNNTVLPSLTYVP